jgi:hypothetical protein
MQIEPNRQGNFPWLNDKQTSADAKKRSPNLAGCAHRLIEASEPSQDKKHYIRKADGSKIRAVNKKRRQ